MDIPSSKARFQSIIHSLISSSTSPIGHLPNITSNPDNTKEPELDELANLSQRDILYLILKNGREMRQIMEENHQRISTVENEILQIKDILLKEKPVYKRKKSKERKIKLTLPVRISENNTAVSSFPSVESTSSTPVNLLTEPILQSHVNEGPSLPIKNNNNVKLSKEINGVDFCQDFINGASGKTFNIEELSSGGHNDAMKTYQVRYKNGKRKRVGSFIKDALGKAFSIDELSSGGYTGATRTYQGKMIKVKELDKVRLNSILLASREAYPDEYEKLNIPTIVNDKCRKSSGEKPHNCHTCGKAFSDPSALKSHLLVHSTKKSHTCDICGKCVSRESALQRHLLIHSGKKPHKCHTCGKAFSDPSTLRSHLRIHSGVHACDKCGKCFIRKSNLQRHLLIHSAGN